MGVVKAPGQLIDVGGFKLHIHCTGSGSPTVVMDSALGGSSVSWLLVQPDIAQVTRVCSYDRAGFGWSDPGPKPRTAGRVADELHVLLDRAGIPPPYVVVGHSFGGGLAMHLAAARPDRVGALLLLDPAVGLDGMWTRYIAEAMLSSPDYPDAEEPRAEKATGSWSDVEPALLEAEIDEIDR